MTRAPLLWLLTFFTPAVSLALTPAAAAAPLSPASILKAQQQLTYSGLLRVTEYQSTGNRSHRVRVTQMGSQRLRQEFLQPDGRLADLVITDDAIRWHHALGSGTVSVSPVAPPFKPAQRLALLEQNYTFKVLGQLRHMQRLALLAQFTPRHPGNLTQRMWVDQARRLPLVIERRGPNGQLVDRAEFLGIRFAPAIKPDLLKFKIPEKTRVVSPHTVLAQGDARTPLPTGLPWRPSPPSTLPPGYQLVHWQYFLDQRSIPTFVWRYHDGLGLVSCFATPIANAAIPPKEGEIVRDGSFYAHGHERAHARVLWWTSRATAYTLIGHLPFKALLQVARSTD